MKLDGDIKSVPDDTLVRVRPRSLLGAKFVELEPGDSDRDVKPNATLPLAQRPDRGRARRDLQHLRQADRARACRARSATSATPSPAAAPTSTTRSARSASCCSPLQRVATTLADPTRPTSTGSSTAPSQLLGRARRPSPASSATSSTTGAITLQAIDAAGDGVRRGLRRAAAHRADRRSRRSPTSPRCCATSPTSPAACAAGTRELPRTTRELSAALQSGTTALRAHARAHRPAEHASLRVAGTVAPRPGHAVGARAPPHRQRCACSTRP